MASVLEYPKGIVVLLILFGGYFVGGPRLDVTPICGAATLLLLYAKNHSRRAYSHLHIIERARALNLQIDFRKC